jgi:L-iditol 2-dehydrogenase
MKAVELVEPGRVEVVEREMPHPGRGEVLVRIKACAICTLERRLFTGQEKLGYPLVFGHEVSGVVEDVGKGVLSDFNRGDSVVLDLLNRCGECVYCRTGRSNQCLNKFNPDLPLLGGMAQFISRPARQVFAIDPRTGFLKASLTEPLSDCVHSLMRTHLSPDMKVLVIGAGTMGLLHLAIVKHYGMFCAVSDVNWKKLEVASLLGADRVIDASKEDTREALNGLGIDGISIAVVTAPGKEAVEEGLQAVGKLGTIVVFSSNPDGIKIEIDPNIIHYQEISITGSEGRTEKDFYQAVSMQNSGELRLEALISGVFPIQEAQRAMEASLDPSMYRIIVAMDETAILEHESLGGA